MIHKFSHITQNNLVGFFYDDNDEWKKLFVTNLGYDKYSYDDVDLLIFLKIPNITKIDILELFEYHIFNYIYASKIEGDEVMLDTYRIDKLNNKLSINSLKPTYASEYINIIGQLFLAGYIDFGCDWDDDYDRIDYPTNLSYYKEDKYQAWIYFRDNFFYKERFLRKYDDNYTEIYNASWDNPQDWSEYNILVARTPKGTKYFNEILAPRFYNKYKDLEVEIDERGNIIQWIGKINR